MSIELRKEYEAIQEMCLSDGMSTFLSDVKKHLKASDTVQVMPIIDEKTKNVLSPTVDEILKRQGYVQAITWIVGLVEYYKDNEYADPEIEDGI